MNSTGPIESWNVNPMDVGPIYPFVGTELFMFAACAACCIAFIVWKMMTENTMYEAEARELRETDALARILAANNPNDEIES